MTTASHINAQVEAHIPRGSGDAEYRIVDAASDNHDVLAIVDPNMTMDDPAEFAERLASTLRASPPPADSSPALLLQRAAEYVERFADANDEPDDGDCRTLLAEIAAADAESAAAPSPAAPSALTVQFECGQEDRMGDPHGPFPFVQMTYGSIRVGENGDEFIAEHVDGWWVTQDGQKWSDVIVAPAIDTTDIPEAGEEWFKKARLVRRRPPPADAATFAPDPAPVPFPDAVSLKDALQWLLDDMEAAGETHGDNGVIFDSVENAARSLINAGGKLGWYEGNNRLPVVIGCDDPDVHGYAGSVDEAKTVAQIGFVNKVLTVERSGPVTLANGKVLPAAYVAIVSASESHRLPKRRKA